MSDIKVISDYISDTTNRTATVYKDMAVGDYKVTVKNESGSSFLATFENIDTAEDFAESWVMNK